MNPTFKLAAAALGGVLVTVAAGGIAFASMDKHMGPFRGADADNNGEITRAEWLQTAGTHFDALDANRDGKLVVGEIPAPPRAGPRHHGPRPHDRDDWDNGPDAAPPADDANANAN